MGRQYLPTAILAAVLMLPVCPLLGAQGTDRPASVVVAVVPGLYADTAYGSVLRDALMVSLTRSRMQPSAAETVEDARAAVLHMDADYLVLGTWRNTTDTLELAVELWLPEGIAPVATGKASGRISLTMDTVAAKALELVLPSMPARFPADAAKQAAAGGTATSVTAAAGVTSGATAAGGTSATASGVAETTGGTSSAATGTVTVVGPAVAGDGIARPQPRWRRVELTVGGAPLVTTGTVADYAKIGAFSTLDLDLRFPVGGSVLAPGLLACAGWFRAVGVGVADILVVPVGPDFHWTIAADANPGVSLHAAAGPAAVVAITSWANTVWKVSPFVAGGLVVDIGLTPALGLRIEADYLVVFEGSMVLQGFTPRLALRARF